jgi:TonB-linked SusC/RagA family outer membrane protein
LRQKLAGQEAFEEDFRHMNWMRHVPGAIALTFCATVSGAAQQPAATPSGIITGRVVHAGTQRPVVSAHVYILGAQVGSQTNAEGRYSITGIPAGARTLRFESVGYGTAERPVNVVVGTPLEVNFEVQEQAIAIDRVVATALGIQRSEKSLGYAVQSVRALELERTGEVTLMGALAGQMAGTSITQSTGQPGGSARMVIRGEGSFRGDGLPLYVIDGVPIVADIDRNSYPGLARGEAGSRLMDLDPANVEEVSVLRGAAATALYGSRAALGAVIIRTKQGVPGGPLKFTFSSRFGQEEAILDGLQNSWAQGTGGFYCNGKPVGEQWCQPGQPGTPDPTANLSWGPHRDSIPATVTAHEGAITFRDPRSAFYNTGTTQTHSLYGTGSMPLGTYGLGFSYTDQSGIVTSSKLNRMNMNANVNVNLSRNFRAHSTLLFANTQNDLGWEGLLGLNGANYTNSVNAQMHLTPPSRDLTKVESSDGVPVMFGPNAPHPQWIAENEYAESAVTRWIVSERLSYTFGRGITLSDQIGYDSYIDQRREYLNERPWLTLQGVANGGTRQQKITRQGLNNDLVLNFDHRPLGAGSFSISGLVGGNLFATTASDISGVGTNQSIPGFYTISNFTTRTVTATLPGRRRLLGLYSQATVDYKDWGFLTLTGRNDWSSTLPKEDNSYFYPSASVAVVFTDALGWHSSLLDYGKARFSVSKVGTDAPPYSLTSAYLMGNFSDFSSGTATSTDLFFPFRAVRGFTLSNNFGNPGIKPESTIETELGFETRLFNGHARADVSFYNRTSKDQIFSVPVAASSGYKTVSRNAGSLRNRGIELSIGATPLTTESFKWDVRGNFTRNWSKVLELADGVDRIFLAGFDGTTDVRITEDHGFGVIWGSRYQRNEDGKLLIGADGFPIVDAERGVLGEVSPDWMANLGTVLTYRSFGVSGLLDIRRGGEIINYDLPFTIAAGTAKVTENRNDSYTFDGVSATTGQPNTTAVVRNQAFWTRYGAVDENIVESADVVRLRELSFTYALPSFLTRFAEMQNLTLFATGRNLKVWTPFSYGDPDGNNSGSVSAGGVAFRQFTVPTTRTWSFGVRATF